MISKAQISEDLMGKNEPLFYEKKNPNHKG
jgi:hypothetical protein